MPQQVALRSLGFVLFALALFPAAGHAQPDLQVVIAADVKDKNIGPGCAVDRDRLFTLFDNNNYKPRGADVNVAVFDDVKNDFTQAAIVSHLESMNIGNNTRVAFFFTGHGDYTVADGHRMKIPGPNGERMFNEAVFKVLDARKKLPFIAVITDSCSPRVGGELRGKSSQGRRIVPPVKSGDTTDLMRRLFIEPNGRLDVNAASEGQLAYGPDDIGGLFMYSLVGAIKDEGKKFRDDTSTVSRWSDLMPIVINRTNDAFIKLDKTSVEETGRPLRDAAGKPQRKQVPQVYAMPDGSAVPWYIGLDVEELTRGGMRVLAVKSDSPVRNTLRPGDTILEMDGKTVRKLSDFCCQIDMSSGNVSIKYERNGRDATASATLKAK